MRLPFAMTLSLVLAGLASIAVAQNDAAGEIQWFHGSFDSACEEAARNEQDVLVYFWSEGSSACAGFWQNQMQAPIVVRATAPFLCYGAKLEDAAAAPLFGRYSVETLPTLLMIDPAEKTAQLGVVGALNAPTVMRRLQRMARNEDTLRNLLGRVAAAPDDLDLRADLAARHASLGDDDRATELRASIRAEDPQGRSAAAAAMILEEKAREALWPAPKLRVGLVRRLADHVATIEPASIRRTGWERIAGLHNSLGDWDEEFAAWQRAYADVTDDALFNWGWSRCRWWWSNRDILSKSQKDFALEVARRTAEVCERLSAEDPEYFDPGLFLTRRLQTLAMMLYFHGEREEATAIMERCVALSPSNAEYGARLAAYRAGAADEAFQGYADYGASWSPTGKEVAFTSTRDGNAEVYVADVRRGSLTRVTRSLSVDDQPAYGLKGLVFRSDRFKAFGIYHAKATGKSCDLLVPLEGPTGAAEGCGSPAVSRDGKSMAFVRFDQGVARVMVGSARGQDAVFLRGEGAGEDSVGWAGAKLVYSSERHQDRDIFLANADGSEERNLTPKSDDAWDVDPAASRDGKRVVYSSWRNDRSHIWMVDSDGSNPRQLTDGDVTDRRPRLSPNGKRIVFDRTEAVGGSRLWIMNADGSGAKPLLGS
ncbi:MAG: LpqB family beta-propeller domain-containing protein [Planctomycetota bacterium]